jgi:hypothetical protein
MEAAQQARSPRGVRVDDGCYLLSAAVLHRLNRLAAYTDQFSKSPMVFDSRGLSGGLHSATTSGLSP